MLCADGLHEFNEAMTAPNTCGDVSATTSFASIAVVVPVYNSQGTLEELVSRLHVALDRICGKLEIILVNDASRDASWSVISDLVEKYGSVTGIDLLRNYGQHNALLALQRAFMPQ